MNISVKRIHGPYGSTNLKHSGEKHFLEYMIFSLNFILSFRHTDAISCDCLTNGRQFYEL